MLCASWWATPGEDKGLEEEGGGSLRSAIPCRSADAPWLLAMVFGQPVLHPATRHSEKRLGSWPARL